jgi:hypothetical protein
MPNIFLKDKDLDRSPAIVGYNVLIYMNTPSRKKVSIFDVTEHFADQSWFSLNSFVYGLIFLYAARLIEFEEPYLIACDAA